MTREELDAAGVPDAPRVLEAARAVADWLAAAPADEVLEGLAAAADPTAALHALARLLEGAHAGERGGRHTGAVPPATLPVAPLLRLLGGSAALAAALAAEGRDWRALLSTIRERPERDVSAHRLALAAVGAAGAVARTDLQSVLRRHRRRELVRIGGRDLLGLASVDDTVRELSALAEASIEVTVACTRARLAAEWGADAASDFLVLGMGKLGGEELNYSSDVDLVYVYERDGEHPRGPTLREFFARLSEEVTRILGEVTADGLCFRVDLRLRPGGGEGPMAISLAAALSYFETWGQTWERAVWLKARPVGGGRAFGARVLAELEPFVHRRYLDFGMLEDLEAMKRRVDASLRVEGARQRDVKLGRGGIREVEFFVQALQLVHVGKDARLRVRGTLPALGKLAECGYVPAAQSAELAGAYRFLRDVEHKLQVAEQRQTHLIPAEPDAIAELARRMGFRGADGPTAFLAAHRRHAETVHAAFAGLFHAPEEARRREADPELSALIEELDREERALWRLGKLGFRDLEAAYRDLRLLRDGPPHAPAPPRRRAALTALAPVLLAEIARSAAPDRALHHVATFVSTIGARTSYLHLLLENRGVLRLLVRLFATSEYLSSFFLRHPELLDNLVRADLVRVVRSREEMAAELGARLTAAPDLETELDDLRRFRHEEFLRIGVHDIEGELDVEQVSRQLTSLAEVCLEAALGVARREVLRRTKLPAGPPTEGLAVVGMGKLGGGELNYNSDLDLLFVYDPGDLEWWVGRRDPHEFFTRVAQRTISALQTPTREGVAYRVDTRLRPSGSQGPLVCSLAAFEHYHRTDAAVWERQALLKARVLSGPPALRAALERAVTGVVYGRGLAPEEVVEIGRLRDRIEEERGEEGAGRVNIKTGRGGLVDVEFLVQVLQLRHGHRLPALRTRSTREALAALGDRGILEPDDLRALVDGYGFLRALENRLRIEHDQPVEAMGAQPEALSALARRLGYEGTGAEVAAHLRADHARYREAIRAAYERALAAAASP